MTEKAKRSVHSYAKAGPPPHLLAAQAGTRALGGYQQTERAQNAAPRKVPKRLTPREVITKQREAIEAKRAKIAAARAALKTESDPTT